jgi:3-deoxy-7-phosphoheptulonate synthase
LRPNYDGESIREAEAKLTQAGLPPVLMVDCSHANSAKQHSRQEEVWRSVIEQRVAGTRSLIGVMVESYLTEGNQAFPRPRDELQYGVSITDACIGWDVTERMLRTGAESLAKSKVTLASVA